MTAACQNFVAAAGSPYTPGPMVGDAAAVDGTLLGAPSAAGEGALLAADDDVALVDEDDVEDVPEPHPDTTVTLAMPKKTTTAALRVAVAIRESDLTLMRPSEPPIGLLRPASFNSEPILCNNDPALEHVTVCLLE